jgi:CO dehydrogenase maturation factor
VGGGRGLRIAVVGKGGGGKSFVAGTLCRQLARLGQPVLAMDIDTMLGLSLSLGFGQGSPRLPTGLAERVEGKGWQLHRGLRPSSLVDRHAACGPDGVRLLSLGKLPEQVEPSVTVAFRYVLERFSRPGWSVVADLAAGTRQPMFGWAEFARMVVVIAEPSAKSLLSARRLVRAGVGSHLVINKVRDEAEVAPLERAVPLPLLGTVPYDAGVAEAEKWGNAPIDAVPDSPAVQALGSLAAGLLEESP